MREIVRFKLTKLGSGSRGYEADEYSMFLKNDKMSNQYVSKMNITQNQQTAPSLVISQI